MKALIDWLKNRFSGGPQPAFPDPETLKSMIASIRADSLSYCGKPKLENIAESVDEIRRNRVAGDYLEAGVALGGSAILLGQIKPRKTRLMLYDVFDTIPAPSERDGDDAHSRFAEIASGKSAGLGENTYYGYVPDLIDTVRSNLRQAGLDLENDRIELIKGLFEDTLNPVNPIALAHIDCDWFDSVQVCIERIGPMLAMGGIMIFDDYSSYSGCKKAVDAYLAENDQFETAFHRRSLGLRRVRANRPAN